MKKIITLVSTLLTVLLCTSAFVIKYNNGIAGRTGAPGESTCSSCHTPGSPVATISISASPAFTGNQYVPGQTYTVSIIVGSPTLSHFGFDCEILNGTVAGSTNSGTISAISGSSQVLNSGSKKNATHIFTAAGSGSPSSYSFKFKWVAPSTGNAAIYAAGVAANNNNNDGSGDAVATTSLLLTPSLASMITKNEVPVTLVKVFPNPSSDKLNVSYNLTKEGNVKGRLYNMQGKEVTLLFNESQTYGYQEKNIQLSESLETGMYMLEISVDGQHVAEKLIFKR